MLKYNLGAYDKTVTIVKDAYTRSTNYNSGAVNSITNQFNPFGTFQLSDDQSGSNSLGMGWIHLISHNYNHHIPKRYQIRHHQNQSIHRLALTNSSICTY
ncbi:CIR protein PIR protein, fragment [Plasmodium vinckei vinckei]|uniref:CIR protein PIR protein n=1 Tax=Plasmodium vinckei vinckei TaxID=54757 RepID=A0A449BM71_PLAVN|nr:CIR protein PIR protein, fragment [Plasmodium vinckei vinckei]VEV54541.1 CIR protein PIR protein, fragment [Plasmodium vinckei vinckei]